MASTVTFDFEFVDENEEKGTRALTLKSARLIPGKILRQNRYNANAATWAALEWAMTSEDLEWFDELPTNLNLEELSTAWGKASETDAGKSEASQPS